MINKQPENINQPSFIVQESSFINFLFSVIFFVITIAGIFTACNASSKSIEVYRFIMLFAVFPAIMFFVKGKKKETIFEINTNGIFYRNRHITNWDNFINAYLHSKEVTLSLSEHFYIIVEYFDPEKQMNYTIDLKLSPSQDKNEDQILEAIVAFYSEHQNNMIT